MKLYNQDCLPAMKEMPDNAFDLAIVDPPYQNNDAIGIKNGKAHAANRKDYRLFENVKPTPEYFVELKRVSRNQIIWGGNFLGLSGGYICWNKEGTAFGEGELAYCSMINSVRFVKYTWNGMIQQNMKHKEIRIHPTQKPVALYKWLLTNYAKQGQTILDTHLGSGSIAIASDVLGFNLTAFEIDAEYIEGATDRLKRHRAQGVLSL